MYYLQTRYYDPEVGRFINSDSVAYLGKGKELINYNLFAYCSNNPVNRVDYMGTKDDDHDGRSDDEDNDFKDDDEETCNPASGGGGGVFGGWSLGGDSGGTSSGTPGSGGTYTGAKVKSDIPTIPGTNSVPNPYGKLGGPEHQQTIADVAKVFTDMEYKVKFETKIETSNGFKPYRYADIEVINYFDDGESLYINVGKGLNNGNPCARERRAISDIRAAGKCIIFERYNKIDY